MNNPETINRRSDKEIFFEALDKATPEERAAFLDGACGRDPVRRRRVEELLANHFQQGSFMQEPAVEGPPTVLSSTPLAEGPGTVIDRYKLLEKVGEGGFGVVYVAEQREPVKRRVALKIIKLGMDTRQVVARFEAERQALALMDHPNIAKVLDAGATETGRPYFVMELVRGVPITRYCDENHLSTEERLKLFIRICQAIQHAHQKGIIHRDIKPSNILITLHDGVPVPKVIDFGIAKATQGELTDKTVYTQFQQFIGTPAYMSPEQAEMSGLDIDTRSDIYSLGVLLYELLTGSTPFEANELMKSGLDEMRKIIREREPIRPSTRLTQLRLTTPAQIKSQKSKIENDLDWIVMKCLEKDRTRRYETANGLTADIQRYLHHEPVNARPPSATYRFQKFVRRNKLGVGAATGVFVALLLGTLVSSWQAIEAHKARKLEQVQRLTAQQERDAARSAEKVAEDHRQRAEQERQRAESERQQAEEARASSQRNLYVANMNLAQQAWEQNDLGRVRDLLEETASHPDRGFEWVYWQRMCRLELMTLRGHLDGINSVALSPDGRRLASASADRTVKVWETASGRELLTLIGHKDRVNSVAFSPDGQRIVSGSGDHTVRLWEAASGRQLLTLTGHEGPIIPVAFSRDGSRIVSGSDDGTARLWEAASGRQLLILKGHTDEIKSVAFSPDDQHIASGSADRTVKVWETSSGRELFTLTGYPSSISSLQFSRNGDRIVSVGRNRTIQVREAASGRQLLSWPVHGVFSVAFSPDSQRILSGSWDGTIKLWEAATGRELLTLKGHTDLVWSVAFSPDGQRIVSTGWDSTIRVWEAASLKQVNAWLEAERLVNEPLTALAEQQAEETERQRAARLQDEGALKHWLILAPIPFAEGQDWAAALGREQMAEEAHLRPKAGQKANAAGLELAWKEAHLDDYVIDLNKFLGDVRTNCVAYAVCYVKAPEVRKGLLVKIGSDDESKVYLNGKLMFESSASRTFVLDQDTVAEVELAKGLNVVVFKIVNQKGAWKGSIRFTDAAGNPVNGIQVILAPP